MTASVSEQLDHRMDAWSPEQESEMWRAFSSSRDDKEFCHAWLALMCRQLNDITAGVVLFQSEKNDDFTPVAIWPHKACDLSFLGPIAEQALRERRGVVHRPPSLLETTMQVAYPIEVAERTLGAVVLEAKARPDMAVQMLLRQLHWGIAWLHELFWRKEQTIINKKSERIGTLMEAIATTLRQSRLQQSLFDVANYLARQMDCARVAIGLVKNDAVIVAALSNTAWFEKNSTLIKLHAAAMEEVYDRLETVHYHLPTDIVGDVPTEITSAHGRLAAESGTRTIISVPLQVGATCLGVLTLERNTEQPFDSDEIAWLETLTTLLTPSIEHKRRAERNYLTHLGDDVRTVAGRLFGPRHLIWKFSTTLITASIAALALIVTDYRVASKTLIEGAIQHAAVAPFEGFVASTHVRAGDTVTRGQELATLDDRDLLLEQHRWISEREQHNRELREAMAQQDLSTIQVRSAQVQQAEAQLALAAERIARARIVAPFDGIVISGDLSQLLGSPVQQGQKLFEIAPLDAYRVILQVDEHEVRHVQVGQQGSLMIAGITGDSIPFAVTKVTPVATAQDGRNFFRVEARLDHTPSHLRPGMEGIGKIEVGERRLWWIVTHSLTDWLRLTLWRWLP